MTLQEWLNDVDGDFIEVGGSANAKNQCVDLVNDYIIRVLGKEPIFNADARMFWDRVDDSYQRIRPSDGPVQAGDIVIFDMGAPGHIAVATGIFNGSKFQTMSQNYPLKDRANLDDYNYDKVIGYLRIGEDMSQIEDLKKQLEETQIKLTVATKERDAYKNKSDDRKKRISEMEVTIDLLSQRPVFCPPCDKTIIQKYYFIDWDKVVAWWNSRKKKDK